MTWRPFSFLSHPPDLLQKHPRGHPHRADSHHRQLLQAVRRDDRDPVFSDAFMYGPLDPRVRGFVLLREDNRQVLIQRDGCRRPFPPVRVKDDTGADARKTLIIADLIQQLSSRGCHIRAGEIPELRPVKDHVIAVNQQQFFSCVLFRIDRPSVLVGFLFHGIRPAGRGVPLPAEPFFPADRNVVSCPPEFSFVDRIQFVIAAGCMFLRGFRPESFFRPGIGRLTPGLRQRRSRSRGSRTRILSDGRYPLPGHRRSAGSFPLRCGRSGSRQA